MEGYPNQAPGPADYTFVANKSCGPTACGG